VNNEAHVYQDEDHSILVIVLASQSYSHWLKPGDLRVLRGIGFMSLVVVVFQYTSSPSHKTRGSLIRPNLLFYKWIICRTKGAKVKNHNDVTDRIRNLLKHQSHRGYLISLGIGKSNSTILPSDFNNSINMLPSSSHSGIRYSIQDLCHK